MSEELTKTKLLPIQGKDMDSIMQNLETGVAELFTSERYQEYLKTMSKFHNYSFNNTLLIAMQRPDATLVTGYRNWQSMGRQVKKGEKGITIIAPAPIKRKKEQAVLDQDQKPVIDPDGKPKTEEVEVTLPCFKAITVFDIEQTTGEPIQTLAPEILTAAVEDFDLFLQAIREISPVPIRFDAIEGSANGYYHNLDKEIVIKKDMSQSQTLKTAIHETAHARLHDKEIMESQGIEKDRLTKEVEAESVAYCVCSAFELDTSEYSFTYIAGWSSGKEMRELKASMDVIRKTAGEMIDELTEKIEMMLEQKQENLRIENVVQKRDILEETSCISFYAAECSEFPVLGEIHHDLSLPEALEAYEKIPAERMNGLKSVGFNLQEGSDYDGMMDLMVAGRLQREILDSIPFYRENKLVQEALKRVEQYIDEKPLNVEKTRPKEEKGEIQKNKSQKRREDMSL
ncbi:hypothetical protein JCM17204_17830 [Blautia stercoris]